jgi:hypothetical protein
MKKFNLIIPFLAILLCFFYKNSIAQTPEGINYQAVARDNNGILLTNQSITVVFTIRQGNALGNNIYRETHLVNTNDLGLLNVVIGQGSANLGTFSSIDWKLGSYYLNTELNGTDLGTTQLMSVPYSLYAKKTAIADSCNSANTANHAKIADSVDNSSLYDKLPKAMANVSSTGSVSGYNYGFSNITRTATGNYTLTLNSTINTPIVTLGLTSGTSTNTSARINYSVVGNQIFIKIYDRSWYNYSPNDSEYYFHSLADGNFSIVVHGK